MEEKLLLARELASCLGGIEVQMITDSNASFHRFMAQSIYGSFMPFVSADTIRMMLDDMQPACLYILGGILDLSYVVIPLGDRRFLCAGPCLNEEFSESRIRAKLRPFRLTGSTAAGKAQHFCAHIPGKKSRVMGQTGIQPLTGAQSNHWKACMKAGEVERDFKSELMIPMPRKRNPKPMTVSPQFFQFPLGIKLTSKPNAMEGITIQLMSKATNCAVTVVPILAPKIIPIA